MSIVKMKRIALVGLDVKKDELLSNLMDFGALELTDQTSKLADDVWQKSVKIDVNQEALSELELEINRAELALDAISKYGEIKSPFFKTRRSVSAHRLHQISKLEKRGAQEVEFILGLNSYINTVNDKINRIDQDISSLTPWKDYDGHLDDVETRYTNISLGVLPMGADISAISNELEENVGEAFITVVNQDKDMYYTVVVSLKSKTEDAMSVVKQHGFTPVTFKMMENTAKYCLNNLYKQREILVNDGESKKANVKSNVSMKDSIENYRDLLKIKLDKEEIKSKLLSTDRTFFIEGWVPEKSTTELSKILDEKECFYEIRDPEEGEEAPVLLKNSSFMYPAEAITEMYSLPGYDGFDPTSIFALFYVCFFGLMFSDAGYGLMLFLGCFVLLKKFDLEGSMYKLIKLFMYCGIATLFWGIMFGGFFGDLISVFSRTFLGHEVTIPALWFNPLEDPMPLLAFSLVLGVIHLFVGMGINAYMQIRDGHIVDAIFDEGCWYVTIPALAMWLGGGMLGIDWMPKVGMYATIVGVVGLLIGGARGKKGFGMITGAFSNVYSITSWMSDILSYARLLALGLATGVIAQVVNTMGTLFGKGALGLILFILVFLVGTAINFAINALGSFVHSARLQYVEFFGKFYVDGGEPFKPFKANTKYIRLDNHN